MSQSANVRSLDAIREFRVALINFIEEARRGISTADSEILRPHTWLESTQPLHWKHEVRHREEKLNQAKSELFRATISQPDNPRGPTDQVRLVRKRQEEIKHAQVKLDRTKRWFRRFEQQINEYRGALAPLSAMLDGNLNKAVVILERSIQSLEAYIASTAPTAKQELAPERDAASIARKGEDKTEDTPDEHVISEDTTIQSDKDIDSPLEPNE